MAVDNVSDYIKSIELARSGKIVEAEQLLAKSVGIKTLTPFMKDNFRKLVDANAPNLAILNIITRSGKDGD